MLDFDGEYLFTDKSRLDSNRNWYATMQGNHDSEGRAAYREQTKKDEAYMKWKIVYQDEAPKGDEGFAEEWGMYINREFHLINLKSEKFMSQESNRLRQKERKYDNNNDQIFKFDWKTKTIKSKSYSTAWSHSLDMRNTWMYLYGTGSQWHQLFRYDEGTRQLYNQRGNVLAVNDDKEGSYITTKAANKQDPYQLWALKYVDEMPSIPTSGKGSMGFEINRPFYI